MAERPGYRLPAKLVWFTEKTISRRDPRSGRPREQRVTLVRWIDSGSVHEKSFDDQLQASRFAVRLEDDSLNGLHGGIREDILFSDWADRFLRSRFAEFDGTVANPPQGIRDGYLRQLILSARNLIDLVGDRPICDYRAIDFETFRTKANGTGNWSPVTAESRLARIRTIFRAAWKTELLPRPPEVRVRDLHYERDVLEIEEIIEIFRAAKQWPPRHPGQKRRFGDLKGRVYRILATLYYSMMRRGELIHLTWDDIRLNTDGEPEILIRPKEWTEPGPSGKVLTKSWKPKDREIRAIPVHPVVEAIFSELKACRDEAAWVFTNTRGRRWTDGGLASLVRRFEDGTGLKVGFHAWRSAGLTHLHDAGVPPGQIQEIAGHSSFSTTMRYVRPNAKGKRKAIRALPTLE